MYPRPASSPPFGRHSLCKRLSDNGEMTDSLLLEIVQLQRAQANGISFGTVKKYHSQQRRRRKQLVRHLNPLRRMANSVIERLELQDLENGISSAERIRGFSDTESIGSKDREVGEIGPCQSCL